MGIATADISRDLAAAAAPGTVLSGERATICSVLGMVPRFIVAPTTVAGVSRVLALASTHGLAVVPVGGGARLAWGAPPQRFDIALSLARLDRVLAHEAADLTLSVECGATLAALDTTLRPHGQFVPLDPARPHASTIGGLIATGAAGPYRARYGTMRDLLLGLTVVRADGTVVKGGGRVVKNVTGYDLPKLHAGALGTLGVIVEAHLRLHPRPAEERSWVFGFASAEAALHAALDVRDTPVVLSRCQLVTAGVLRALAESEPPAAALAVTIGSVPEAVRAQGAQVADICGRMGSPAIEVPQADGWWQRIADVTWPENPAADLAMRIGIRPTDAVKALRAVEAVRPSGSALRATINLATGVLHATLAPVEAVASAASSREPARPLRPSTAPASWSTLRRSPRRVSMSGGMPGPPSTPCGASSGSSTRRAS